MTGYQPSMLPSTPRARQDRSATVVLYAGFFVFGLLSTVIGVALPNIKQEFQLSNQQAGLVFVCWSLGTLIGSYAGGKAFRMARVRALLSATSLIAAICLLFLYGERQPALFRLHVFIVALAASLFLSVGHATAAHVTGHRRVATLSLMDFCVSVGNLTTPLLVNYLVSRSGADPGQWRLVFVVSAVLLVGVVVLVLGSDLRSYRPDDVRPVPAGSYRAALAVPMFLMFTLASLFVHATEWGHTVWFVTYASEIVHLPPAEARETFSLFLVGMAVSRLLGVSLVRVVRPTTLMAVLVAMAAVAALSIAGHHNYHALRLLNFVFGLGLGALFPLLLGLSMDRAPGQAQLLSGIGLMAGTVGAKSTSYLMGVFADRSSLGQTYTFVAVTTVALVGCVLGFLFFHLKRRGAELAPAPARSELTEARTDAPPVLAMTERCLAPNHIAAASAPGNALPLERPITQRITMQNFMNVNILVAVLITGGIAAQNLLYSVAPEEQAVITRLGTVIGQSGPGLHWKLPLGIDRVQKLSTRRILRQEFGFRSASDRDSESDRGAGHEAERQMLTGDLDMIEVSWTVHYAIRDPIKYLGQVKDPERVLREVSESVMRRLVGDRSSGDVLTTARVEICGHAQSAIQDAMNRYDAGLDVKAVELQGVFPPQAVRAAFNQVNDARQERERMLSDAMKQRNEAIPRAQGEAKRTIAEAEADAVERVNRARGEVAQFAAVLPEYHRAPAVTRRRLYLEAMGEVAPKAGKIIVVEGGPVVPQALYHLNEQAKNQGGPQ